MPIPGRTNHSIWSGKTRAPSYPALSGDLHVDVVIIGAGITGISAAHRLIQEGRKVAVLEAYTVGSGTTGSSTGNLYESVDKYLQTVQSRHNDETLSAVTAARGLAIDTISQWVSDYAISCDLKQAPWYLFTTKNDLTHDEVVRKEFQAAQVAGLPATNSAPADFPFKDLSEITVLPGQAQLNPLKYVQELSAAIEGENCRIFENSRVTRVEHGEPCSVLTERGTVTADQVIMATHTPKGIFEVQAEMEVKREYVVAARLNGGLPPQGMYWHLKGSQHYSVRPYSNAEGSFLLALGEPHLVGTDTHNEDRFGILENYLREHFDVQEISCRWAAQSYSSADGLPYIGNTRARRNVYIATGFAADGLVYGTLAALLICDRITGKDNPWYRLFEPTRFAPVSRASGFVKENLNVARHLIKDYVFYKQAKQLQDIMPGQGKTLKLEGERVAAHRDDTGRLHIVSAVCPHLGCIVHWNSAERSWDCPCHGSRFSIAGEVLEGPAIDSLAPPSFSASDRPQD